MNNSIAFKYLNSSMVHDNRDRSNNLLNRIFEIIIYSLIETKNFSGMIEPLHHRFKRIFLISNRSDFFIPPPLSGLTMNSWAVAGPALSTPLSSFCDDIFFKAEARDNGLPEISAPPASAAYSLDLEIASWSKVAAMGANIKRTKDDMPPLSSSLSPPLPLNIIAHPAICAI